MLTGLAGDRAPRRITGLRSVPDSGCLAGQWMRRYQSELGSVPVFVDGTGIEVAGRCFEQAGRG